MQHMKKQEIVKVKVRGTLIQQHVSLSILNPGYEVGTRTDKILALLN